MAMSLLYAQCMDVCVCVCFVEFLVLHQRSTITHHTINRVATMGLVLEGDSNILNMNSTFYHFVTSVCVTPCVYCSANGGVGLTLLCGCGCADRQYR